MKTIIETTYQVKVAHGQGTKPLVDTDRLKTVRSFLNKQNTPFNFDVNVFQWDGDYFEIMTYTGADFLTISDPNKVKEATI